MSLQADEAAVELSNIRESISVRNFRNVADGTDSTKGEQARELDDGSPSVPGMQHTLVTETTGIEPQWVESLLKLAQRRLREDTQDSTAKKTSAVLATAPKRSMSMR